MLLRVDPGSSRPLFEQIAASVRGEIARGALVVGDRLPGARDVAHELGVNHHTVLRAYQDLRDEGVVELRRGRGAVVTASATEAGVLHLRVASLVDEARALGIGDAALVSLVKAAQQEV